MISDLSRAVLSFAEGNDAELTAIEDASVDAAVSYRSLSQGVQRLHCIELGPSRSPVAIHAAACVDVVAWVLALLALKRPFVLIDSRTPVGRKKKYIHLSRAQYIVEIGVDRKDSLADHDFVSHLADGFMSPMTGLSNMIYASRFSPGVEFEEDAAYIVFTSGTTGDPKGVIGSTNGLCHFIDWQVQTFPLSRSSRVAQLTNLSFDVALRDIFYPLASGATLCIPDPASRRDARALSDWIARTQVSNAHIVPSIAARLVDTATKSTDLRSFRRIFFAGEPLSYGLVNRWRVATQDLCEFVNLYGPSETSLAKFYYRVAKTHGDATVPVGAPLPGVTFLLLDDCGNPTSTTGNVAIATPFNPLGYLQRALNKDRFKRLYAGGRYVNYYLTGDLGEVDMDGVLHLRGRVDDEIKLEGVRINPSEICSIAEELPFVSRFAVSNAAQPASAALIGFWMSACSRPDDAESQIRAHLVDRLPGAAVPNQIVEVDEMPLSPNGKVDRKRLLATLRSDQATTGRLVWQANCAADEVLKEKWIAVLGSDPTHNPDFYAAGGDSLKALELQIAIEEGSSYTLAAHDILSNPTADGMSAKMSTAGSAAIMDVSTVYPLTRSQKGFYLFHVEGHEGRSWCGVIGQVVLPDPTVDTRLIATALAQLAARHAALRVRIVKSSDGQTGQEIEPDCVPIVKLISVDDDLFDICVSKSKSELQRLTLQLDAAPLWISQLVRSNRRACLLLVAHHLIVDGWSMRLIEREILQAIAAPSQPLSPVDIDYRDFLRWDATEASSTKYYDAVRSTAKYLLDYSPPKFEEVTDVGGFAVKFALDAWRRDAVIRAARARNVSVVLIYHAAYVLALHRFLRRADLVTGALFHGRDCRRLRTIIGNVATVRHIRTAITADLEQFLSQLDGRLQEASRSRSCEFIDVLRELGIASNAVDIPVNQLFFNFQRAATLDDPTPRAEFSALGHDIKHRLMLMVYETPAETGVLIEYRGFERSAMEELRASFLQLVDSYA